MKIKQPKYTDEMKLTSEAFCVIPYEKGTLILPKASKNFNWVKVIFCVPGIFFVVSNDDPIHIGNMSSNKIGIEPGESGFDTQPSFIYVPTLKRWQVITQGMIHVVTEEEEKAFKAAEAQELIDEESMD